MKKKIGILTFINAYNMGAVLQGYALVNVINRCNRIQCEQINYYCEAVHKQYSFPKIIDFFKNPKQSLMRALSSIFLRKRYKKFREFKQFIPMSSACTKTNYKDIFNGYDKVIVGSDQVWNPAIIGMDKTFYFSGVKCKKYSYAASIGVSDIADSYKKEIVPLLKNFEKISVRENEAANLLTKWEIPNVKVVCDPVFLMKPEEWKKLGRKPVFKKKYIFIYKINNCSELLRYAENLASKRGWQIVSYQNDFRKLKNAINLVDISPFEWIGYIENAEYVVTNSFHATAFSIIMQKQFAVEIIGKNNANGRLYQLLHAFDLTNRILVNANILIEKDIDYKNNIDKLDKYSNNSKEYLNSIIEE